MRLVTLKILSFLVFIVLMSNNANAQKFHRIPTQIIDLNEYVELISLYEYSKFPERNKIDTIKGFQISDFILYKEYKEYLKTVKKDSSKQFYITQLPDTSITIDKIVYQEYITNKAYDNFPVIGISWENAMNYCKWKTLKDNKKEEIKFIYILPKHSEWIAALNYYEENNIKNDLSNKYSDWTLNTFDETAFNFGYEPNFDWVYLHKESDRMVLKRKRVVGESYLYHISDYNYGYSTIGYRYIGFRVIKTKVNINILDYWGIEE